MAKAPSQSKSKSKAGSDKQLLHLVFGGELTKLGGHDFRDTANLDMVGMFPNYATAFTAWKGAAQRTVDNAHMRYFIVHVHRLLEVGETPVADAEDVVTGGDIDRTG